MYVYGAGEKNLIQDVMESFLTNFSELFKTKPKETNNA